MPNSERILYFSMFLPFLETGCVVLHSEQLSDFARLDFDDEISSFKHNSQKQWLHGSSLGTLKCTGNGPHHIKTLRLV